MEGAPFGQEGVDQRKAHGTAEVPRQVEQAGGVLDHLRRQHAKRDVVDRHHAQHQGAAAQDLRQQQLVEIPVLRQAGDKIGAKRKAAKADAHHHARIEHAHQPSCDGRGQEHGKAADEHGLADLQRGIAADAGEIDRIEIGQAIKPDAHDEAEQAAHGEVFVAKGAQVRHRLIHGESPVEEQQRGGTREHGEQDDVLALEPVVAGPLLQHIFERPEEHRHGGKAGPVELVEKAHVRLVEVDQRNGGNRHEDAGMTLIRNSQCQDMKSVR